MCTVGMGGHWVGIVNVFISADELPLLRGLFGLVHRDSSRKEAEKTFLFPTFQEKYPHHCMKLTIPHGHIDSNEFTRYT